MSFHRWWLALVATLLTPWLGPHSDAYVPIGWVLLRAGSESPDMGFWIVAGILLCVAYGLWLAVLSGIGWLVHRRRHRATAADPSRPG